MSDPGNIRILVTGAAGFIGAKVCEFLLTRPNLIPSPIVGDTLINTPSPLWGEGKGEGKSIAIVGLDNLNDYYDVRLKHWRLSQLKKVRVPPRRHPCSSAFVFHKTDIENYSSLRRLFLKYSDISLPRYTDTQERTARSAQNRRAAIKTAKSKPPFAAVINLAARAGVRYSLENPFVYYTTNVMANLNLLELCREFGVKKYVFASSSSLYAGQKMPFKETLPVNEPISPYAASKESAEVTCYTYHKLYNIDISILRYFTVYGPASRPDMSPFRFMSWMYQGKPIIVYGDGKQSRDFTYIDDIARGTILAMKLLGFEIINLGGDEPHRINEFLRIVWQELNRQSKTKRIKRPAVRHRSFNIADMRATWADIHKARRILKWKPEINLKKGVERSVAWFLASRIWTTKIKI